MRDLPTRQSGQILRPYSDFPGKAFLDKPIHHWRQVYPYPPPIQFFSGNTSGGATTEWVKHHVTGVAGRLDDSFK